MVLHVVWQNGVVCWLGPAPLVSIFRFEYLISGPKSYRDFRETGPTAYKRQFTAAGKEKKNFNKEFPGNKPCTWLALFDQAWWEPRW